MQQQQQKRNFVKVFQHQSHKMELSRLSLDRTAHQRHTPSISATSSPRSTRKSVSRMQGSMRLSRLPQKRTLGVVTPSAERSEVKSALHRRQPSVDVGRDDWPNKEDMSFAAPPITGGDVQATRLVADLRALELYVPQKVDEDEMREKCALLPPGAKPPPPPMEVQRVHLPCQDELHALPEVLQAHLQNVAMDTLRAYLHPIVALRQRMLNKKRVLSERVATASAVPVEFISTKPLFRTWAPEYLNMVTQAMKLRCFEPKEFVVFEREQSGSTIFLHTGAVQILQRINPKSNKKYSPENVTVVATHNAPAVFGELSLLTEEPWQYAIRVTQKADMWVLYKPEFSTVLAKVPQHVMGHTIRVAFERRNESMRANFPMDSEAVRAHPIFATVSNDFARDLADKLEPFAVPKDYLLFSENELPPAMYFIRQGSVGLFRVTGDGERTQVGALGPGMIVGDTALAYSSASEYTAQTSSDSDMYQLTKASLYVLTRQYPSDLNAMLDAARAQRQEELHNNQMRFREIVRDIPFISDLLPPYYLVELVQLLRPRSYRPLSSVCSTSSFCDRILILTKGKIRLGTSDFMQVGDCIGWTCCVPHRWARAALTMNMTVEALEIPCEAYMTFLQSKNLLGAVIHRTKMVLFPKAFPREKVERLLSNPSIVNQPIMHPVSSSTHVNLNEIKFCTVHLNILAERDVAERQRRDQIKGETPPPYRQLSVGVWIPKARKATGFNTRK